MSRIVWDQDVSRSEFGIDRGVLYISGLAVAWSGITGIEYKIVGGEQSAYYFDGNKVMDVISSEDFSIFLQAITYPEEFEGADGLSDIYENQPRTKFNLTYRTLVGSNYKIHLVYNAIAFPGSKTFLTKSDFADPSNFDWDISTTPVNVPGAKPSAHLVLDTTYLNSDAILAIESILYGDDETPARLPTVDELIDILSEYATLVVIDHGDGTWTATGPDEVIEMLDSTTFQITWPSAIYTGPDTYIISSF